MNSKKVKVVLLSINTSFDDVSMFFDVNGMTFGLWLEEGKDGWGERDNNKEKMDILDKKVKDHIQMVVNNFIKLLNEGNKDITL